MQNVMQKKLKNLLSRRTLFILMMLSVPVAHFIVFWIVVNVDSILLAFQYEKAGVGVVWGFENFKAIFHDLTLPNSEVLIALRNTMIFFASKVLLILPLSLLLCYFLYKRIWMYRFFRYVFYLPVIIAPSVLVIIFRYIIAANGPIGVLTQLMGKELIPFLTNSRYALGTILFYTVFFGLGGNMVLLSGAMNQVDTSVVEAGVIDGVNTFQEIFHIVIPGIFPTLSTLIIFDFVGLFGSSGPILLFTAGEYKTNTISFWIYSMVLNSGSYNYAAALGLLCTLVGAPIALLIKRLLNGKAVDID